MRGHKRIGPAARASYRAQSAACLSGGARHHVQRGEGGALGEHPAGRSLPSHRAAPGDASEGRAGAPDPADQRSLDRKIRSFLAARHPERRPAHAARGEAAHPRADPERVRAGKLRHVGRDALLRAPGGSGGGATGDLRAADFAGRRGETRRRRGRGGCARRGGRADLPRALYAARLLRRAGIQREAVHARRVLPLGRPYAPAPVRQLRRRRPQEGSHQPRRRKDQRRGDREPDSLAPFGAEHRVRRDARSADGREDVRLRDPERRLRSHAQGARRVPHGKGDRKVQAARAARSLARFSRVDFREGFEENARRVGDEEPGAGKSGVRIIDLHCYPGTREWIACQGPYVEALAKYWNRSWTGKDEDQVIKDFTDAGVEAVLVALDLETTIATPPCTNEYVQGMWKRHPERIIQAWGAVEPSKPEVLEQARKAVKQLGFVGFHFH